MTVVRLGGKSGRSFHCSMSCAVGLRNADARRALPMAMYGPCQLLPRATATGCPAVSCTATLRFSPRSWPIARARRTYSSAFSNSTRSAGGHLDGGRRLRTIVPRCRRQPQETHGVFGHQLARGGLAEHAFPLQDSVDRGGEQTFRMGIVRLIHEHAVAQDVDHRPGHLRTLVVFDPAENA